MKEIVVFWQCLNSSLDILMSTTVYAFFSYLFKSLSLLPDNHPIICNENKLNYEKSTTARKEMIDGWSFLRSEIYNEFESRINEFFDPLEEEQKFKKNEISIIRKAYKIQTELKKECFNSICLRQKNYYNTLVV